MRDGRVLLEAVWQDRDYTKLGLAFGVAGAAVRAALEVLGEPYASEMVLSIGEGAT